ncbi:MAG: hypothetical protein WAS28_05090 [Saprospiraceae bacterium]
MQITKKYNSGTLCGARSVPMGHDPLDGRIPAGILPTSCASA